MADRGYQEEADDDDDDDDDGEDEDGGDDGDKAKKKKKKLKSSDTTKKIENQEDEFDRCMREFEEKYLEKKEYPPISSCGTPGG